MKLEKLLLDETFGSELKRKVQGKVSGKAQAKRIGLQGLKRFVDGTSQKNLEQLFGHPKEWEGEKVARWIDGLRKSAIEAIEIIRAVED